MRKQRVSILLISLFLISSASASLLKVQINSTSKPFNYKADDSNYIFIPSILDYQHRIDMVNSWATSANRPCDPIKVSMALGIYKDFGSGRFSRSSPSLDIEYNSLARSTSKRTGQLGQISSKNNNPSNQKPNQSTRNSNGTKGIRRQYFLSYSRKDIKLAKLLKAKLEKFGYTIWVDFANLIPGLDWQEGIDNALQTSAAVLVLLSPNSKKSDYVIYEWAFALGSDTPVVPILIEKTSIHSKLASLQWLDFSNNKRKPWAKLFSTLNTLGKKSQKKYVA